MILTGKPLHAEEVHTPPKDVHIEDLQKPKRERKEKEYHGLTAPMCLYLLGLKMYPFVQYHLTSKEIKEALAWHLSEMSK